MLITRSAQEKIPLFLDLIKDLADLQLQTSIFRYVFDFDLVKLECVKDHNFQLILERLNENLQNGEHLSNPLSHKAESSCKILHPKSLFNPFSANLHKNSQTHSTYRQQKLTNCVCWTIFGVWSVKDQKLSFMLEVNSSNLPVIT